MSLKVNLTRRVRRRKLSGGVVVRQTRYVLNYREPNSGQRRQEFFERQKDAQERKAELTTKFAAGTYVDARTAPTVAEALEHWLADRAAKVKVNTIDGYKITARHIRGPILAGTAEQRAAYGASGRVPKGAHLLPMLGAVKLPDLTTAAIRAWHREVAVNAGAYTANRAASQLHSVLALAEEDFGVRAPSMPNTLARRRSREKKTILSSADIATLIAAARQDPEHGIFYAFPFLAGT